MTTPAQVTPAVHAAAVAMAQMIDEPKSSVRKSLSEAYAANPSLTPEYVARLVKKGNVGLAYSAWYVHKSGIPSNHPALADTLIAEYCNEIVVKDNVADMVAELKRVKDARSKVKAAAALADAESGQAFIKSMEKAGKAFSDLKETIIILGADKSVSDALVMSLVADVNAFAARYNAVANTTRESVLTNA